MTFTMNPWTSLCKNITNLAITKHETHSSLGDTKKRSGILKQITSCTAKKIENKIGKKFDKP